MDFKENKNRIKSVIKSISKTKEQIDSIQYDLDAANALLDDIRTFNHQHQHDSTRMFSIELNIKHNHLNTVKYHINEDIWEDIEKLTIVRKEKLENDLVELLLKEGLIEDL